MSDPLAIEDTAPPENPAPSPEPAAPDAPAEYFVTPKDQRVREQSRFVELPRVTTDQDYARLRPGAKFTDEAGKTFTKPWLVKNDADYKLVPEGATFTDVNGAKYKKPAYEGVDYTTQTLHNMATNDKERRRALAKAYGDESIKTDPAGDMYVTDEKGVLRKPGNGGRGNQATRAAAFVSSEAAPVIGGIGGAVAGLPASPFASFGLAGVGTAAGQGINDAILALAGIYDRTPHEEGGALATAGTLGTLGEVGGRTIGKVAPAILASGGAGPRALASFTGATQNPEAVRMALKLQEQGVLVPTGSYLPEAPMLDLITGVFDPRFRGDVMGNSAREYYERKGGELAGKLGLKLDEPLTAPTKPVSTEEAGQAMLTHAANAMAAKNAALDEAAANARAALKTGVEAGSDEATSRLAALRDAHTQANAAAQKIVDDGFGAIQKDVDEAKRLAGVGESPGDLARASERSIRGLRSAIGDHATRMYNAADAAAGNAHPFMGDLPDAAQELIQSLPEAFAKKHPDLVKMLAALPRDAETAETSPTFGQLHNLRSRIRSDIDYSDLTPSVKQGALKRVEDLIDTALHDTRGDPRLTEAARMLDETDAFYRENIQGFKHKTVQWLVDQVEAGLPPNAERIANAVLQPNEAELISHVRGILGTGLWNAVQHSDTQAMLNAAKTTVPGQLDGSVFAKQVLDRIQDGILQHAYSPELAAKLTEQANKVLAMQGKLPMSAVKDETLQSAMSRAAKLAEEAEAAAVKDPLGTLDKQMRQLDGAFRRQSATMQKAARAEPLGFLLNSNATAIKAANRVLDDPDLFMAAAHKFGEGSDTFQLLKQTAAHRILQENGPSGLLAKLSDKRLPESVQELIFPGTRREELVKLAQEMDFLTAKPGEKSGASIAATTRVTHPLTGVNIPIASPLLSLLGVNSAARAGLGAFYKTVTNLTSGNPALTRYIIKGLDGDDAARAAVRDKFQQLMRVGRYGGPVGAGTGAAIGANE